MVRQNLDSKAKYKQIVHVLLTQNKNNILFTFSYFCHGSGEWSAENLFIFPENVTNPIRLYIRNIWQK